MGTSHNNRIQNPRQCYDWHRIGFTFAIVAVDGQPDLVQIKRRRYNDDEEHFSNYFFYEKHIGFMINTELISNCLF